MTAGITGTDWIRAVQRHCSAFHREERNTLAVALSDTTGTTVSLGTALGGIVAGSSFEVDTEMMYVTSANPSTNTCTVIRGSDGSTAATHAQGAQVTVNPRFPAFDCFLALNDTLRDLTASNYFQMKAVTLTFDAGVFGYNLTGVTDLVDLYTVRIKRSGTQQVWDRVDNFTLHRNMDPAEFASTFALFLYDLPGSNGQPMRVLYKAPFGLLTATSDDVSVTGLPTSSYDVPPIGAALRLLAGREVKRNFTEGAAESRRAGEVPPGAVLGSMRGLQALFDRRVESEVKGLLAAYPPMTRMYVQHPSGMRGLVM